MFLFFFFCLALIVIFFEKEGKFRKEVVGTWYMLEMLGLKLEG